MKRISSVVTQFIFSFVLINMFSISAFAQTADEYVSQGKQELFENRNPVAALGKFNDALALDSLHPQAHFWHAVTALFSNADFLSTLQSLNMMDTQYAALIFDNDSNVNYDFNRPYPDATALQTVAVNLIPELDSALNDCAFVNTSFSDSFTIPGHSTIDIDYADAKMVEGIINLLKVVFSIYGSYDVDNADVQDLFYGEPDTGMTKWDTLLSDYPDALNLLEGHASKLLNAKGALLNAISCYFAVSDYIRDDRLDNDGLNHLIQFYDPYDPDKFDTYQEWQEEKEENLQGEQYFRNKVVEMNNNLLDSATYPTFKLTEQDFVTLEEDAETAWVNFDAFFTNPQNARSYINEIEDDMMFDNFSDPTMGGIFPDFTTADWNYAFRSNSVHIDTITVLWDEETPEGVKLWLEWYDEEPHPNFVQYKIFRATTIDVDDSSDLVATVTDATLLTCIDDSFDTANNVYYYRVYTYYDVGAGVTSTAKSELGKVIFRVYVDAGNALDENQDGTQAHPYSNLAQTLDDCEFRVSNGTMVYVAGGTYRADEIFDFYVEDTDGLNIRGGYEPLNWTRDITANPTIIDHSGNHGSSFHLEHVLGVKVDGFIFDGAQYNQSGMFVYQSYDVEINNCVFTNNMASYGGALAFQQSNVSIRNCEVSHNNSCGIKFYLSSGLISNTVVANNEISGIQIENSSGIIIEKSIIKENNEQGIMIWDENYGPSSSNIEIVNNLIIKNRWEGISFIENVSTISIVNNTIVNNGGAIYSFGPNLVSNDAISIINNIVAYNSGGIEGFSSSSNLVIAYNNIAYNYRWNSSWNWPAGQDNNISVDPMFSNNMFFYLGNDSPCIDAGDNSVVDSSTTDFYGESRIVNGVVDIGASEFNDSDNDNMPDIWESNNNLNPNYNDAAEDADNDALSNMQEFSYGTDANNNDTDNDGLLDGDEGLWIGDDFQINTFTDNVQNYPSIAGNGLSYLVTWETTANSNSFDGIYGQLFNNEGTKLGEEFQIQASSCYRPSVASDGINYFVVWVGSELYGKFYDNQGNEIAPTFRINSYVTNYQRDPSIASNGNNYFVVWSSDEQDGSDYGVYGQLYDNEGNKISDEFRVNTYTTDYQHSPALASNGNNYLVAWTSAEQYGNYSDIYAQFYDNRGHRIGDEFMVNTYTYNYQGSASVASNGTTYLVVWRSWHQDGSQTGIFGQFYNYAGDKIGSEFRVNTHTYNYQNDPLVVSDGVNYLVTWINDDDDSIRGQFYGYNGNTIGTEFITQNSIYQYASSSNGIDFFIAFSARADIGGKIIKLSTDPLNPDSDDDGLSDGYEVSSQINPLAFDSDMDGLYDGDEVYSYNSSPTNPDTDNDGMDDGDEVYAGMEPDNAESLFRIIYYDYESDIGQTMLQWQGSVSNSDFPYTIIWCDDLNEAWSEVIIDPNDYTNDNGIRTWFDDGDNDSTPPRSAPDSSYARFYQILVK